MENAFRYVFDENLYNGYWEPMPNENGREVFRISYPEHAEKFGDFFEVIETGNRHLPYKPKKTDEFGHFYGMIINWFTDHKLLSG
jgi:hypothetical protein